MDLIINPYSNLSYGESLLEKGVPDIYVSDNVNILSTHSRPVYFLFPGRYIFARRPQKTPTKTLDLSDMWHKRQPPSVMKFLWGVRGFFK